MDNTSLRQTIVADDCIRTYGEHSYTEITAQGRGCLKVMSTKMDTVTWNENSICNTISLVMVTLTPYRARRNGKADQQRDTSNATSRRDEDRKPRN